MENGQLAPILQNQVDTASTEVSAVPLFLENNCARPSPPRMVSRLDFTQKSKSSTPNFSCSESAVSGQSAVDCAVAR